MNFQQFLYYEFLFWLVFPAQRTNELDFMFRPGADPARECNPV
jgi:hypothetical protein